MRFGLSDVVRTIQGATTPSTLGTRRNNSIAVIAYDANSDTL